MSATFLQMRIITWVREERAVGELQATGGLTRCVCALDRSSQRRVAVSVWVAGGVGAAPGRSAHRFEIVVAVGEPCDLSAQRTCRTIGQGISSRSQHTRGGQGAFTPDAPHGSLLVASASFFSRSEPATSVVAFCTAFLA